MTRVALACAALTIAACSSPPNQTSCTADDQCRQGERCDNGACVPAPPPDAGAPDAGEPDAGSASCSASSDCPAGEACDVSVHQCVVYCGPSQPCNQACCSATGRCTLVSNSACGIGTACEPCAGKAEGSMCLGDRCGCHSVDDCGSGLACDGASSACGASCDPTATAPCKDACCIAGRCGNNVKACGPQCLNCSSNGSNKACVGSACGCNFDQDCSPGATCDTTTHQCSKCTTDADCPTGMACDATSGICSAACTTTCNGACCQNGTCVNSPVACGPSCANCAKTPATPLCITGAKCGCAKAADCPVGQACMNGVCTTKCNPAGGGFCNGGCCYGGVCVPGTSVGACGSTGGVCSTCTLKCCISRVPYYCSTSIFGGC